MLLLLVILSFLATNCATKDTNVAYLEKLFTRDVDYQGQIYKRSFFEDTLALSIKSKTPVSPIDSDGLLGLAFNMGTKADVHCYVHPLSLPGTNISSIIDKVKNSENIEKILEPATEVTIYKSHPVIFVASFYETKDKLLGDFKLAHVMLENHSINCTHDEPGYRGAFRSAIKYLVENSEDILKTHKIIDKSVYIVKLGEVTAGFVIDLEAKSESERFRVNYQSLAIPVSQTSLKTFDSQSINFLDRERKVIKNISLAYQNESLDYQIGFDKLESKKYQIQGVHREKGINRVVKTPMEIVIEEDAIKKSVRLNQNDFDLLVYQPSLSPRDFILGKVSMDADLKKGTFTTPKSSMTFYLDQNQDITKQIIHAKDFNFVIERVYRKPLDIQTALLGT